MYVPVPANVISFHRMVLADCTSDRQKDNARSTSGSVIAGIDVSLKIKQKYKLLPTTMLTTTDH